MIKWARIYHIISFLNGNTCARAILPLRSCIHSPVRSFIHSCHQHIVGSQIDMKKEITLYIHVWFHVLCLKEYTYIIWIVHKLLTRIYTQCIVYEWMDENKNRANFSKILNVNSII